MIVPLLSGILAALSFPTRLGSFSLFWGALAWFALVPALVALERESSIRQSFRQGFLLGIGLYALSLYWIFIAMFRFGGVPWWGSLIALSLLVTILSLFLGGVFSLAQFLKRKGVSLGFSLPILWILQDWVRNYFPLNGFSWSSLAYSQGEFLNLIQIVDLTGPYGVTFLILLNNFLLASVFLFFKRERKLPKRLVSVLVLLLIAAFLYSSWRERQIEKITSSLPEKRIALIQGNVFQEAKWEADEMDEIIQLHLRLSHEAEKVSPDLILWPEAAYPVVVGPKDARLVGFHFKTPFLVGAVTYDGTLPEVWPVPAESDFQLYNTALLVGPDGTIRDRYRKNHLVPMGEYVPLKKLLFFLDKIVPGIVDFSPGGEWNLIEVAGMKIGITICYEDLFPEISRRFVKQGADFLVNLTNDGWYEKSSAIGQHAEFSRFRAIENRRFLARATNTGVTALYDPTGRIVVQAPLFGEAILPATVKLGGPMTFYTRFGDLFIWVCLGFLLLVLLKRLKKRS